jgi:hypothetical protein
MKTSIKITFATLLFSAGLTGCYYDNEEDLYIGSMLCDTTNMTFTTDIKPMFAENCDQCHSGSAPQAGISTDDFQSVVTNIDRIYGSVNHLGGYRPMPDNGDMLPDCNLNKINAWIKQGLKEN